MKYQDLMGSAMQLIITHKIYRWQSMEIIATIFSLLGNDIEIYGYNSLRETILLVLRIKENQFVVILNL